MTVEPLTAEEGSESLVLQTARNRAGALEQCRSRFLATDADVVEGAIQLEVAIDTQGAVSEVRVAKDEFGNTAMAECVQGVLRRLGGFPATESPATHALFVRFGPRPPTEEHGPTVP